MDLALLLTVDAVLRLALTGVALWLGGGAAALGWATTLPILLTVAIGILRGGARLRSVRTDAVRARDFHWNTARAVFAGVGAAFFVAGFPAVLAVFAGSEAPAQFATLVLVITLTRAPLLMPLSAIQSLLVVRFTRLTTGRLIRAELLLLGVVSVIGLAGAALGAVIGPQLLTMLFGPEYEVDSRPRVRARPRRHRDRRALHHRTGELWHDTCTPPTHSAGHSRPSWPSPVSPSRCHSRPEPSWLFWSGRCAASSSISSTQALSHRRAAVTPQTPDDDRKENR